MNGQSAGVSVPSARQALTVLSIASLAACSPDPLRSTDSCTSCSSLGRVTVTCSDAEVRYPEDGASTDSVPGKTETLAEPPDRSTCWPFTRTLCRICGPSMTTVPVVARSRQEEKNPRCLWLSSRTRDRSMEPCSPVPRRV